MASLFVAVPYTRPHYGAFLKSLLMSDKNEAGWWFNDVYGVSLDIARNYLISQFLNSDSKYLLFIDNDCVFHPGAINRLISRDVPMVCAGMYTRTIPPKPTAGMYMGKSKDGKDYYRFLPTVKAIINKVERSGGVPDENDCLLPAGEVDLFEVDGCGMHFTLIRRDVVEAVRAPYFVSTFGAVGGEDFYFCRQVKAAGYPIYMDLSVHTGHSVGEEMALGIREMLQIIDLAGGPSVIGEEIEV